MIRKLRVFSPNGEVEEFEIGEVIPKGNKKVKEIYAWDSGSGTEFGYTVRSESGDNYQFSGSFAFEIEYKEDKK